MVIQSQQYSKALTVTQLVVLVRRSFTDER